MTLALGEQLGTAPVVTPILEGPGRFAPWEARMLGIRRIRRGHVRQVVLAVRKQSVLTARTLCAFQDPAVDVLSRLGTRPLAQVLFEDRNWRRISAPVPVVEVGQRIAGPCRVGRVCLWQYGLRQPSRLLVEEFFESTLVR